MIRIEQLKLPVSQGTEGLKYKILKTLRIRETDLISYEIHRKSLDARRKPELYHIYTIDAQVKNERKVLKKSKSRQISYREKEPAYQNTPVGSEKLAHRPVIVGTGPAGLFCGYELARMGYQPILLERGMDVDTRVKDVEGFWNGDALKAESNVQFGEGGAGTFSDGKLNTLIKDVGGRNREVLRLFAKYGAPEEICYENKPHIGTDILINVVKNIRNAILHMGGEVRFHSKVTDIHMRENRLSALTVTDTLTGKTERLETTVAVLAIGHSARDTFFMLKENGIHMEPKSFAVGVRIEHPQALINRSQYGSESVKGLPAAAYKLTANLENGRGVYTFCMCPGGYVVNASSEEERLAINGMSYSGRSGANANSAVIVTVTPEDYQKYTSSVKGEMIQEPRSTTDALCGIEFQRQLEASAYQAGSGKVPVQRFGDFCQGSMTVEHFSIVPQIKGAYEWGNVRNIFPRELADSLVEGILAFDKKIPGYASDDALVSGVESRTSSPVRIPRDENLEGNIEGLYPCGEGAGYAGGITSSATDGLKVAEAVSRKYRPFDKD